MKFTKQSNGQWKPGNLGSPDASMSYPTKSMRAYQMCYSTNQDWFDVLPTAAPAINVVSLAFITGTPPSLVGWTTLGSQTALSAALIALRNVGVRISLSFGGGGNTVGMSRTEIVDTVNTFSTDVCPVDSVDIDVEAGTQPTPSNLKLAADDLRSGARGPNFGYTVTPSGATITESLAIAVDLQANGYLHAYGQQFYDAAVDDATMKFRISQAITAGVPFSKWEMGVMNPGSPIENYWTVDTAITRINSAIAEYGDTMRGSYYWETMRTPTAQATPLGKTGNATIGATDGLLEWSSRVGAVV